jgi:hypothetical protein
VLTALAVVMLLAAPSRAEQKKSPEEEAIDALIAPEWEATRNPDDRAKAIFYWPTTTVDLPASWPPNGDGRLSRLVYASGHMNGLADAELRGSIWARIVLDAKTRKPSFQRLSPESKDAGMQGVRPMTRKEIDVAGTRDAAIPALEALAAAKGAPKTPDPVLRAYYCQWKKFSGAASELPHPEIDFLNWLDCGRRDSPGAERNKKGAESKK